MNGFNQEAEELAQEPEGAKEPTSLEEAFGMLAQDDKAGTAPDVQGGAAGERSQEPAGSGEPAAQEPAVGDGEPALDPDDGHQQGGGSAAVMQEPAGQQEPDVDYSKHQETLTKNLYDRAADIARKKFKDENIGYIEMSQLMQRDERTGELVFIDPDTKRPFKSRMEADEFCQSWNRSIDREFRKQAQREYDELRKMYEPTMRMYQFASTFSKFDQQKKDVVNEIISPYAIKDKSGSVIGYSCDLAAAAKQADRLIEKFGKVAQPTPAQSAQEPAAAVKTPALDHKSSGSGTASSEPKNLAEALMMVQQQKGK